MKEQIQNLLYDLKKMKTKHGLKSITGHKTDIPVADFYLLKKEFNLDCEMEDDCLFASLHVREQNIFLYLKSVPCGKPLVPIRTEDEPDYCAYDEIAHED